MNLGKFRKSTEHYSDDFELVISSVGDRHDIGSWGVINYTRTIDSKPYCLLIPEKVKMTFKEFSLYVKDLFWDWFENNIEERTRDDIMFWIQPIGSFAALDISLRGMAGLPCWHRIAWYNICLLLFNIRGKFKWLSKDMQEYYNLLQEYKKDKGE
jgi:hypothetical protein